MYLDLKMIDQQRHSKKEKEKRNEEKQKRKKKENESKKEEREWRENGWENCRGERLSEWVARVQLRKGTFVSSSLQLCGLGWMCHIMDKLQI